VAWFHIYWLNLSYLPIFFIFLGLLVWLIVQRPSMFALTLMLVYVYLYTSELEDFLLLNSSIALTNSQTWLFNNLLTNLLNKYHPGLFYVSVVCLTLLVWGESWFHRKRNKGLTHYSQALLNSWWGVILQYNVVALTLGSWWALQEGTWGGWWNWDPSETLGLLVSFTVLLLLHLNLTKNSLHAWLTVKKALFYVFVLSYFFIQLNFEIVSHNFNFKLFHFFNSNTTLIQFCTLTGLAMLYQASRLTQYFEVASYVWTTSQSNFIRQQSLGVYLTYLAFIPFLFLPLVSYLPIVNYFTWNFFHITFFYQTQSAEWFSFLIILSLVYRFTSACRVSVAITAAYSISLVNFTYIYVYCPNKPLSTFHLLLVLFLVLNVTSIHTNYLVREFADEVPNSTILSEFFFEIGSNITFQDGILEKTLCWSDTQKNYT